MPGRDLVRRAARTEQAAVPAGLRGAAVRRPSGPGSASAAAEHGLVTLVVVSEAVDGPRLARHPGLDRRADPRLPRGAGRPGRARGRAPWPDVPRPAAPGPAGPGAAAPRRTWQEAATRGADAARGRWLLFLRGLRPPDRPRAAGAGRRRLAASGSDVATGVVAQRGQPDEWLRRAQASRPRPPRPRRWTSPTVPSSPVTWSSATSSSSPRPGAGAASPSARATTGCVSPTIGRPPRGQPDRRRARRPGDRAPRRPRQPCLRGPAQLAAGARRRGATRAEAVETALGGVHAGRRLAPTTCSTSSLPRFLKDAERATDAEWASLRELARSAVDARRRRRPRARPRGVADPALAGRAGPAPAGGRARRRGPRPRPRARHHRRGRGPARRLVVAARRPARRGPGAARAPRPRWSPRYVGCARPAPTGEVDLFVRVVHLDLARWTPRSRRRCPTAPPVAGRPVPSTRLPPAGAGPGSRPPWPPPCGSRRTPPRSSWSSTAGPFRRTGDASPSTTRPSGTPTRTGASPSTGSASTGPTSSSRAAVRCVAAAGRRRGPRGRRSRTTTARGPATVADGSGSTCGTRRSAGGPGCRRPATGSSRRPGTPPSPTRPGRAAAGRGGRRRDTGSAAHLGPFGGLVTWLGPPLADDEQGPYAQERLVEAYTATDVTPEPGVFYFESLRRPLGHRQPARRSTRSSGPATRTSRRTGGSSTTASRCPTGATPVLLAQPGVVRRARARPGAWSSTPSSRRGSAAARASSCSRRSTATPPRAWGRASGGPGTSRRAGSR